MTSTTEFRNCVPSSEIRGSKLVEKKTRGAVRPPGGPGLPSTWDSGSETSGFGAQTFLDPGSDMGGGGSEGPFTLGLLRRKLVSEGLNLFAGAR